MDTIGSYSQNRYPTHIGIIMDGNGRWAKQRSLPRSMGHFEGVKAAKRIVQAASELEIPYLTFYAFSTENWSRPSKEVDYLMNLFSTRLFSEINFYNSVGARILVRGNSSRFPSSVQNAIISTQDATSHNRHITVTLAINYGGQDEIVRSVNRWLSDRDCGEREFSAEDVMKHFDHPEIPTVDYIIRSGGERRISNFLLWESAYAELMFYDSLWPDWRKEHLVQACEEYANRIRRYGGVLDE